MAPEDDVLDYVGKRRRRIAPRHVLLAIICLVFVGALISNAFNTKTKPASDQPSAASPQATSPASKIPPAPAQVAATQTPPAPNALAGPYAGLTSIQIVEKATALEKRMTESNRPKSMKEALKQPLITKEEVRQTLDALANVMQTDPKYEAQAHKLVDRIHHDEIEGERAMKAAIAKAIADDVDGRKDYAKALETNYLRSGLDINVSVSGAKGTILNLKYVLFSRPLVYNLTTDANGKETDFVEACRKQGFTKIVFTDGYDKTWSITLRK